MIGNLGYKLPDYNASESLEHLLVYGGSPHRLVTLQLRPVKGFVLSPYNFSQGQTIYNEWITASREFWTADPKLTAAASEM